MWEEALAIDPTNQRATSFLDYIKLNYELLANAELALSDDDDSFAIEEEPEYRIAVSASDLAAAGSVSDQIDDGWSDQIDTGWFEEPVASDDGSAELLELEA